MAILAVALIGDVLLPDWLGIDIGCWDKPGERKLLLMEVISCAATAGLPGWVYLAWFTALPILFVVWLRRAVRRSRR